MNRLLLLLMLMPCIAISAEEKTTWACTSLDRHIVELGNENRVLSSKSNRIQRLEIGEYESTFNNQNYTCVTTTSEVHCANFNNTETFTFYKGLGLLSHIQNVYYSVSVEVSKCEVF